MKPVRHSFLALALAACASLASTARAEDGGWHWIVAPYLWGTGMDSTTEIGPVKAEVDMSFSDVVSHMDLGGMLRVVGRGDRWGTSIDVGYVNLSETTKPGDAEVTSEQFSAEIDGLFSANEHFDVLFGARGWKLNNDIDFDNPLLADVDRERSWVDPVVGFIARADMGETWDFAFRGDVGGFGVGSDLSWQAEILFSGQLTERFVLGIGWRVLGVDYDEGSGTKRFVYDAVQMGPEIGFGLRF